MGVSALELRRRVLMAQPHKERKTGGIVSFKTHVPQVLGVSVPLSPVQAGTGDPYPPGGGINIINVADGTITLNDLYYVDVPTNFQLTAGETYTLSLDVTSTLEPFSVSVGCGVSSYTKDITFKHNNNNGHITLTFTPTEAQLEGRPNLFIRALRYMTKQTATAEVKNYQLEKGATAHDFAPYSNIRPITGWTGATAYRTGKNLLPQTNYKENRFSVAEDGTISQLDEASAGWAWGYTNSIFRTTLPPGTYSVTETLLDNVEAVSHGVRVIAEDNTTIRTVISGAQPAGEYSRSFTISKKTNIGVAIKCYSAKAKLSIVVGETAAPYAPYSGESFPFTFPDTVYGGRLEPAAGRVVVDRAKKTFNGSESWEVYAHAKYGNTFRVPIAGKLIAVGLSICDAFTNISDCWGSNGRDRHGVFSDHTTTNRLYFRAPNASVDDLAAWTAWLSENPVTVVYYLATPVEIPLTPAEIRALMGENNVFSDAGDVEVEFWTN